MRLRDRVLEALRRRPATSPELAAELGVSVAAASVVLSRLAAERGIVRRVDDGRKPYRYALAGEP